MFARRRMEQAAAARGDVRRGAQARRASCAAARRRRWSTPPTRTTPDHQVGSPEDIVLIVAGGEAGRYSAVLGPVPGHGLADRLPGGRHGVREPVRRAPSARPSRSRRAATASSGRRVALLDISKRRGDEFLDRIEARLREHGAETFRVVEGDLLQARRARADPPHRRPRRPGGGGPRRLRLMHVVQCARHGQARAARGSHGGGRDRAVRSTRPSSRRACSACRTTAWSTSRIPVQLLTLDELHARADAVFEQIVARLVRPRDGG